MFTFTDLSRSFLIFLEIVIDKCSQKQPLEAFCKKAVLRNFARFTGKHLCLRPAALLKKRLWHRCFPVNFAKFLRTSFLQNTSGRVLLCSVKKLSERLPKIYSKTHAIHFFCLKVERVYKIFTYVFTN